MAFITGIITAIGGALGAVGSFLGGFGILGRLAIGIGLNVLAGLIQKKNAKKEDRPVSGVQFEHSYGGDVGRQVACGKVGIAGHDCHVNTYGPANGLLQQVFVLSDYLSDGLSRVAINGKWVTLGNVADPVKGLPVISGDYANLIWIKFHDGTQTAADAALVAAANPVGRWTAAFKGIGITYVIVSMTYDAERNNTLPDFFFEFRGAPLYDWRKDSTVGGSGPQRWANKATHAFTANPAVIEYNYRRGIDINGDVFCGMEMDPDDLPLDRFTVAANLCDETVGGEHRYTVSIMLDCMATHGDNIEALMMSCGGMTIDGVEGSWPLIGSDQPIVATLTDDDLIVGEPVKFRARRSMGELVNSVSGTHPDPNQLWAMTDYAQQTSPALVALDRRSRDVSVDFPMVTSKRQCGQLAGIYLEENRWEATAQITARPRWQELDPGDWIRWNSDRYGDRVYMVTERSLRSLESDGPRNVALSLQERDGSIYDGITAPPIVLPWPPGVPQYATEAQDFQVLPITVVGNNDDRRPGFLATWDAFDDPTVTHLEIRYWPSSQPTRLIPQPPVPSDQSTTILVSGVVSKTLYKFQHRIVTSPRRLTVWSAPIEVESLEAPTTDVIVDLQHIAKDMRNYYQARDKNREEDLAELLSFKAAVTELNAADVVDRKALRKQFGKFQADFLQEVALRSSQFEAFAAFQTQVSTRLHDAENGIDANGAALATLQSTVTALDGKVTANSSKIDAARADITSLHDQVLAAGDAFQELNSKVVQQGNSIQANSQAISAANAKIAGLDGKVAGQASSISSLSASVSQINGRIQAFTTQMQVVQALANDATANGLLKWSAAAGPGNTYVRIELSAKATANGKSQTAGIYVDVNPTFGRVSMRAPQIVFFDGGASVIPIVFENGIGKFANAQIGNLTFNQIVSVNKKWLQRGYGSFADLQLFD